jgi:hypothetical protein
LAKSNYQFEKRQKELAKQKKQEEKRRRKLQSPESETTERAPESSGDQAVQLPDAGKAPD